MFSSSVFTNDMKCFFIIEGNCKGFSVARMGIGSWFQNLAAMYENDLSPELLTLGRTKDSSNTISGVIRVSFLDHGDALFKYRGAFPWISLCMLVETICCTLNLTGSQFTRLNSEYPIWLRGVRSRTNLMVLF